MRMAMSQVVLDEAHKAKSAAKGKQGSKTGELVMQLQSLCANARVVYASATPVSLKKKLHPQGKKKNP